MHDLDITQSWEGRWWRRDKCVRWQAPGCVADVIREKIDFHPFDLNASEFSSLSIIIIPPLVRISQDWKLFHDA